MADIELNVEVRAKAGSGAARAVRREGKVPGVLYGGPRGPVPIAMNANAFGKALYTGKLLGHLVTLRYGEETQSVIAKDVQFHPVSDKPMHFDLYRVGEHQLIRIAVPVHFRNQEASPGLKRGGTLNVSRHEVELMVRADHIPEEVIADLTGLEIGDTIRISDIALPEGAEPAIADRDFTVATIASSSSQMAADAAADEAAATAQSGAAAT
ncbi:50S ribosomal protein L25/general stress protein Ctc [Caulobacter sp. S45]|uniref:50S ribosomal protein L25/general stress protein Ctc n=1 Tax=Caulobacter sp. S45 TaxID=1641861 RepID=UPI001576702E|nr:50S ribosomal protein L25/general stress protein Ctc [Caulobacter sp. S45]